MTGKTLSIGELYNYDFLESLNNLLCKQLEMLSRKGVAHNMHLVQKDRIRKSDLENWNNLDGVIRMINEYDHALSILSECILGINEQGYITFISRSYAELLGYENPESIVGKYCTEVIDNSRLHEVVKTGKSEIGYIHRIKEKDVIATRIPIKKNGKTVGAIGKIVFQDVHEVKLIAKRVQSMESKLKYYQEEIKRIHGAKYSFQNIVGESKRLKEVKDNARLVAESRSTILITGETGTGKELFAHAIHLASPRSDGPFIRVNCAAIPRELLEAELFGYEGGAFTGANKNGRAGKFELAQTGTLFLDEIGDMPLEMQSKLLRVLQEKEFERVGGTKIHRMDVRIITATHQDLREMIKKGKFREDLYYRLNVFMLDIPPLRERKEDIIPITKFLMNKLKCEIGRNVTAIDDKVKEIFLQYDWPGNIRELENVLERSINVLDCSTIELQHLPVYMRKDIEFAPLEDVPVLPLLIEIEMTEKRAIMKALEKTSGNKQEAAKLLGIHRASLYRKIEKYHLDNS